MRMRIHGQFDSEGRFMPYTKSWDGVLFGDTIRDPDDGWILAVKDEYGWVSPTGRKIGKRWPLKVEQLPDRDRGCR